VFSVGLAVPVPYASLTAISAGRRRCRPGAGFLGTTSVTPSSRRVTRNRRPLHPSSVPSVRSPHGTYIFFLSPAQSVTTFRDRSRLWRRLPPDRHRLCEMGDAALRGERHTSTPGS